MVFGLITNQKIDGADWQVISEIFDEDPHLNAGLLVEELPAGVALKYARPVGGSWQENPEFVMTPQKLRDYLSDKRWRVETGGITVNGMAVNTDDRAKILAESAASTLADTDITKFKIASGVWHDLTGLEIREVRDALAAHVRSCFAKAAQLDGDIGTGAITTIEQIEAANWPG